MNLKKNQLIEYIFSTVHTIQSVLKKYWRLTPISLHYFCRNTLFTLTGPEIFRHCYWNTSDYYFSPSFPFTSLTPPTVDGLLIHLHALQCQAAWESLITLLQDKQTEDKTSETNWNISSCLSPLSLCITRTLSCQGKGPTGRQILTAGLCPFFSCEMIVRTGESSLCKGGNEWNFQGQQGKRRDLLCTDIFLCFTSLLLTFSTSYF